jgi:putative transposase
MVMPRRPRRELAGAIHHVTARGNNGETIFRDAVDRHLFLRTLGKVLADFQWRCLTYCLMSNHYHLLVLTDAPTLSAGMERLQGSYAQRFNARHRRRGHLWGERYHAVLVENNPHLLEAIRYIALNPVTAGLCAYAEAWQWSGHRALAGLQPPGLVSVEITLSYLAADGGDGRQRYDALIGAPRDLKRGWHRLAWAGK